jgi:hypothetical protein
MPKKVRKSGDIGSKAAAPPRRLLFDVCRCRDEACPQSNRCLRFIQRDFGASRVETTRESGSDACNYFIGK